MSAGGVEPHGGFVEVAAAADLWVGEMEAYAVGDREVLVVHLDDGFHAYDGICPHQSFSLVEGLLDGNTLTCAAHAWEFDVATGEGTNPRGSCLVRHGVQVIDGALFVSEHPLCTDAAATTTQHSGAST
jgi:nitrite reductase/ring-hydroxylating ferredoxin subunit